MIFGALIIGMAIISLLVASYCDLRFKEVPDWLNYGLIFTALGVRAIFSIKELFSLNSIGGLLGTELVSGIFGLIACLFIGLFFYYAGQWGGGDSKLLMGMGAVIGINYPFDGSSFNLFFFFLGVLFLGAIFGLLWMLILAVRNQKVWAEMKTGIRQKKRLHWFLIALTLIFIVISVMEIYVLPFVFFPLGLFYLFSFVEIVEKNCFLKTIPVLKLTEGDWLADDIKVEGKLVMKQKTLGSEDLRTLREHKVKTVCIKEGVPFVPSFLFAYLFLVFGGSLISWILKSFFA